MLHPSAFSTLTTTGAKLLQLAEKPQYIGPWAEPTSLIHAAVCRSVPP